MKLEIFPGSENYACVIAKVIHTHPHPNADKLQLATVCGVNVITDLNTKPGDIVLYFSLESKLADVFLTTHDLYRRKDEEGKPAGGFFEDHGRVKAVKLRGVVSNGFIMPVSALDKLGFDSTKFNVGDQFNAIDGVEICRKYTRKTRGFNSSSHKPSKKVKEESKIDPTQFRLHYDTPKFGNNLHGFALDHVITISNKIHGTSFVVGNVLCKKPIGWFGKLLKKFGFSLVEREYDNVFASRKVIKNPEINRTKNGYYGEECIWEIVNEELKEKVRPSITLYGEIVGQLPNGKWIQSGYRYGTVDNQHKTFVYRITSTTPVGDVIEFSWNQIAKYCNDYGIETVPVYFHGTIKQFLVDNGVDVNALGSESVGQALLDKATELYLEQTLPEGVPDEGVVIRNETAGGYAFKLKSLEFFARESKMLDDENSADMEEEQSLVEEGN